MNSAPPPIATEPVGALRIALAFVLIDLTDGALANEATIAGTSASAVLDDISTALGEQANRDVAEWWGGAYTFRVAKSAADRMPGEVAINIRPSLPDAPGALGFHYVTAGVPDIEIGLDVIEGLTKGNACLSAVISHEVCETIGDPGANRWAERRDGKLRAMELCDTIEDTTYLTSNGVEVSNFLLPAAFVPGAPAPWDQLQVLTDQDGMTPGGYDIEASAPNDVSQVTPRHGAALRGNLKPASGLDRVVYAKRAQPFEGKHLARKKHPFSRTSRRGVRL